MSWSDERVDRREFCSTVQLFARSLLGSEKMGSFDVDQVADAVEELGYTDLRDAPMSDVERVIRQLNG